MPKRSLSDLARARIVRKALCQMIDRDFRDVRDQINHGDWDETEMFVAGLSVLDLIVKPDRTGRHFHGLKRRKEWPDG